MKEKLEIDYQALNEVNQFLTKKDNPVIDKLIKNEIIEKNLMPYLEQNYLDKHEAVQRTAQELLKNGIPVKAATKLH